MVLICGIQLVQKKEASVLKIILHRATRWGLLRYHSRLSPNNSCFRRKGFFQQSWGKWPCCCYLCRMLEYILNKYIPSGPLNLSQVVDPLWSPPAKVIINKLRWMCFCSLSKIYILKSSQNKKGQKNFQLHRFWPFLFWPGFRAVHKHKGTMVSQFFSMWSICNIFLKKLE